MTDIPDDVVERALDAMSARPVLEDPATRLRIALRVAVEWEREQCAKVAEQYVELVRLPPAHDLHSALDGWGARSIAAAIRARSEGDH